MHYKKFSNKTKHLKRTRFGLGAGLYDTNFYLQTRGFNPEQIIFQPYLKKYKRKICTKKNFKFQFKLKF